MEQINITFKNNGTPFTFHDKWCGGKNTRMIHYDSVLDELASISIVSEDEIKGKLFKHKVTNKYIELSYREHFYKNELTTKRISIEKSEYKQAVEICELVGKIINNIAEEKRLKKESEEERDRKRREERKQFLDALRNADKSKVICLDVETTGLDPYDKDEILQLSIINGNNEVLFNEYIKPKHRRSWPKATEVTGITYQMVKDKANIDVHIPVINEIIANSEVMVGYNIKEFDLDFIMTAGIKVPSSIKVYDVMLEFAPIYGKWDDYHCDYKWQKLSTCAKYYGYKSKDKFHDSLADVKATLFCFYQMIAE